MDIPHAGADKRSSADRDESDAQRLDRNWSSLLQELRVAQTGVVLITGFLLTLPFQQRFDQLDGLMRNVYLVTVACSLASTLLLIAPVSLHRVMFRRHRLDTLVSVSHVLAMLGLLLLGAALAGVAVVIFDTVAGRTFGWVAGASMVVGAVVLWLVVALPGRGSRDTGY